MKFKVGQKVKVKDFYDIAGTIDRAHCTHGLPFTRTMLELCGKTFTITNIRNSCACTELVADVLETGNVFVEEWLELVSEKHYVTLHDIYKADEEYASFLAQELCVSADLIVVEFTQDLELIPEHYYKSVSAKDVEFMITNDHSDVDDYHTHAVVFEDDAFDFISNDLVAKILCKKTA